MKWRVIKKRRQMIEALIKAGLTREELERSSLTDIRKLYNAMPK